MAFYESVFITRQDISAAQTEALANQYAEIIRQNGGTVQKTEYWGLRTLAYKIRKNRKGHYVMFNLDAPPAAVAEMERNMGISEDVLRFLTVRVEALEQGPSPMMQAKSERGERGDRGERGERGERGDRGDRGDRGGRRGDSDRFDRDRSDRPPRPPRRAEPVEPEGEPS